MNYASYIFLKQCWLIFTNKTVLESRGISLFNSINEYVVTMATNFFEILHVLSVGGGGGSGCSPAPYQIFLFFADEQFSMCTLSWHTSARAEAGLFSSYKALKAGGGNSA